MTTKSYKINNFRITLTHNDNIYIKVIDEVSLQTYENNIEYDEITLPFNKNDILNIILDCFILKENFNVSFTVNKKCMKLTFDMLFNLKYKHEFYVILNEKNTNNNVKQEYKYTKEIEYLNNKLYKLYNDYCELEIKYNKKNNEYNDLEKKYNEKIVDFDELEEKYNEKIIEFNELEEEYNENNIEFDDLVKKINVEVDELKKKNNKNIVEFNELNEELTLDYNKLVEEYNDKDKKYEELIQKYNDTVKKDNDKYEILRIEYKK